MHAELRCYYCTQLIANSDDAQRIERRTFAHTVCAFVVNDKYFLALDEREKNDNSE